MTTSPLRKPLHINLAQELLIFVVFIVAFVLLARQCFVFVTTPSTYAPVKVSPLRVEPNPLVIGQPATLFNGLCLDQPEPLIVKIYLGLQAVGSGPIISSQATVDLVGQDTPEGRRSVTLSRGCVSDRMDTIVPAYLPTGRWILVLHLIAMGPKGQTQNITEKSDAFDIIAP